MTLSAVRICTAVVAIALVAAGCSADPLFDDEPLSNTVPHGWATTMPVGSVFTDGLEILHLDGHQPAVIKSISMVGNDQLELIGASLATPKRDIGGIQQLNGYPPTNPHLPEMISAAGASITPRAQDEIGWELLLGIKVVGDGYLVRDGIVIEYSVAGKDYRLYDPAQLVVCTSDKYYHGTERCPFPHELDPDVNSEIPDGPAGPTGSISPPTTR